MPRDDVIVELSITMGNSQASTQHVNSTNTTQTKRTKTAGCNKQKEEWTTSIPSFTCTHLARIEARVRNEESAVSVPQATHPHPHVHRTVCLGKAAHARRTVFIPVHQIRLPVLSHHCNLSEHTDAAATKAVGEVALVPGRGGTQHTALDSVSGIGWHGKGERW
jgi:hypothetical protein